MKETHYDARGLICPLPVLKARKILMTLPAGALLRVSVTDAYAPKDFEIFCADSGHRFVSAEEKNGVTDVIVECRSNSKPV